MKRSLFLSFLLVFAGGCLNKVVGTAIFGQEAWNNIERTADCLEYGECDGMTSSSDLDELERKIIEDSCYQEGQPGADQMKQKGMKKCDGSEDDSYDSDADEALKRIQRLCRKRENRNKPVCQRMRRLFSSTQAEQGENVLDNSFELN